MAVPPSLAKRPVVISVESQEKNMHNVRIANPTDHRVAWRVSTDKPDGMAVEPSAGLLEPRETGEMKIKFESNSEKAERLRTLSEDRFGIEWVRTSPEMASEEMSEDWFNGSAVIHRKNFSIGYE